MSAERRDDDQYGGYGGYGGYDSYGRNGGGGGYGGRGGSRTQRKDKRRRTPQEERARCRFCRAKLEHVDYKDVLTLQKLVTSQGKMFSRKRSGNCARHQRISSAAIKLARFMSLMPYIGA